MLGDMSRKIRTHVKILPENIFSELLVNGILIGYLSLVYPLSKGGKGKIFLSRERDWVSWVE